MKLILSHLPSFLKNKFFIAGLVFLVWICFFDTNDLIIQAKRTGELRELRASKAYFTNEIAKERKTLEELRSNPAAIEKFVREKYLMKRDNEDLFLIRKAENN